MLVKKILYFKLSIQFLNLLQDYNRFLIYPFIRIFGSSFRVPKFNFNKDLCTFYGLCEENCPTHVIVVSELPKRQKGCIYCFNCVMVCPTGAIYSDLDKVKRVLKFNAKVLHEESIREIL